MKIIILAGGNGTRLFPLSRECYPKQFLKIAGQESLLQQTIKRFLGLVKPEDILLIINQDHIFHAKADLAEIGASQVNIADLILNGGVKVIESLLPILDDMERAQQNIASSDDIATAREGLDMIFSKLQNTLGKHGLKKMETADMA